MPVKVCNQQITPHFNLLEWFPNPLYQPQCISREVYDNIVIMASKLEKLRLYLGLPMIITSGYRTLEQNIAFGSTRSSAHLIGAAVDVTCSDMKLLRLYSKNMINQFDQVIFYPNHTFIHLGFVNQRGEVRHELLTLYK